jgi:hypothetical protein
MESGNVAPGWKLKRPQLTVFVGIKVTTVIPRLREIGIFIEGAITASTAAVLEETSAAVGTSSSSKSI